jgi:hypothetical protein
MATWKRLTLPAGEEPHTIDVNMELVCYMLSTQSGGTRLYFSLGDDKEAGAKSVMESLDEIHSSRVIGITMSHSSR